MNNHSIKNGANAILTLGENKHKKIYAETFFFEPSNKYNSGQNLLIVNDIIITEKHIVKKKKRYSAKSNS